MLPPSMSWRRDVWPGMNVGVLRPNVKPQLGADECDERFWMYVHEDIVRVACVCGVLGRIMGTM